MKFDYSGYSMVKECLSNYRRGQRDGVALLNNHTGEIVFFSMEPGTVKETPKYTLLYRIPHDWNPNITDILNPGELAEFKRQGMREIADLLGFVETTRRIVNCLLETFMVDISIDYFTSRILEIRQFMQTHDVVYAPFNGGMFVGIKRGYTIQKQFNDDGLMVEIGQVFESFDGFIQGLLAYEDKHLSPVYKTRWVI